MYVWDLWAIICLKYFSINIIIIFLQLQYIHNLQVKMNITMYERYRWDYKKVQVNAFFLSVQKVCMFFNKLLR